MSVAVHIYASADLQWFEVPADTALGQEVTQGDQDCRRIYRRVDSKWWGWLFRMHNGYVVLRQIRARLVELRGEDAVTRAEATRPDYTYFPPLPRFPEPSPINVEMQCT